jgi:hypothetical protein
MRRRPCIHVATASLVLLGSAALAAPSFAERLEERSTQTVPCDRDVAVTVTNLSGATMVEAWDRQEVQVEALAVAKSRDVDRARRMLRGISYDVDGEGDHVAVTARYPRRDSGGRSILDAIFSGGESVWIEFVLRLPKGARLAVSSTSGNVQVDGIAGPVQVDATSGDVGVAGVPGNVQIECTSGDVDVKDVGGLLRVYATSGEVHMDGVGGSVEVGVSSGDVSGSGLRAGGTVSALSGEIRLSGTEGNLKVVSSSGDVSLRDHRGGAEVKTSSGDMEISLRAPLAESYRMDASSGSVHLEVPQGSSLRLDLSTASGTLRARLPIEVEDVGRHRLVGMAGKGKSRVEVTTATGDIEVVEEDGS